MADSGFDGREVLHTLDSHDLTYLIPKREYEAELEGIEKVEDHSVADVGVEPDVELGVDAEHAASGLPDAPIQRVADERDEIRDGEQFGRERPPEHGDQQDEGRAEQQQRVEHAVVGARLEHVGDERELPELHA
ncbi:hypothetical protein J2753_002404 [Halolamina salifodinae]|uniref:Uncharacterized protein n=1 Tax=Halolamina salifodinae TaxID=1202767 RepID=A0A8T4H246_9EURY|nr:hypothetical protein [Halolamina salifodinae]MBP1987894.1 hypothetical protein [Halolamina salifodinae]